MQRDGAPSADSASGEALGSHRAGARRAVFLRGVWMRKSSRRSSVSSVARGAAVPRWRAGGRTKPRGNGQPRKLIFGEALLQAEAHGIRPILGVLPRGEFERQIKNARARGHVGGKCAGGLMNREAPGGGGRAAGSLPKRLGACPADRSAAVSQTNRSGHATSRSGDVSAGLLPVTRRGWCSAHGRAPIINFERRRFAGCISRRHCVPQAWRFYSRSSFVGWNRTVSRHDFSAAKNFSPLVWREYAP